MTDHMDAARRRQILKMFPVIGEPPQADNPVVDAIMRGDQLYRNLFTRDTSELFDPVRCPPMYEVTRKALRDLHTAIGEPANTIGPDDAGHIVSTPLDANPIRRVTFDGHDSPDDPFTPLDANDPALYVYFVSGSGVTVLRGLKPVDAFELATCGRGRPRRGVDYFRGMFQVMMSLHDDFWDRECNARVSRNCGGPSSLLPYRAGAFLLIFEICKPCLDYAQAAADKGYELSVMEAHARVGLPFP
ncbi:hypothetical protein ONA92_17275 [Mycobacteroides salmoniphilum]|uniref:hypothetical protein n=1 Tax=Mycobacteroides salmoniphilum TaxID=404941 RepID=UPI003563AFC4